MAQKYFKANITRLENLRIERGWSREVLADKAIVSTRTLDSLMAGGSGTLSTFTKIARALSVEIGRILDGYDDPEPPKERVWMVTITVSTPFDQFDETRDLPLFLSRLLSKLGGNDLALIETGPGSTEITLDLTDRQLYDVTEAFLDKRLNDMSVERIAIPVQVAGSMASKFTTSSSSSRLVLTDSILARVYRDQLLNAIKAYLQTTRR
jgi:transcriptional regulator with XRE-family HTH domain